MRVALYVRVSTTNHDQKPDLQLDDLRRCAEMRGWQIVDTYVDQGVSGAKEKRPELDRLMADAAKRRFDIVAVWKFDRFARSVSHLLRALEHFQSLGIEFFSYSESIDTSTAYGKMTFTVLGAVAELERSLLIERVRAGLRSAKARGKRLGRMPRFDVKDYHIARLRSDGLSNRAIARQLGCSEYLIRRKVKPPSCDLNPVS